MERRLSAWSPQKGQTFLYVTFFANREIIKQVGTFEYSGFTITPDARCDTEIQKRITLSEDKISKLKVMVEVGKRSR